MNAVIAPGGWRRVAVVGASGTGKTELAAALARAMDVPRVQLDDLRWRDRQPVAEEEFVAALEEATRPHRWVVEGVDHSPPVRALWRSAHAVVWLDHSPAGILVRMFYGTAWLRGFRGAGRGRLAYARYLAGKARRSRLQARELRRDLPQVTAALADEGVLVVRLRSVTATRRWLRRMEGERPV